MVSVLSSSFPYSVFTFSGMLFTQRVMISPEGPDAVSLSIYQDVPVLLLPMNFHSPVSGLVVRETHPTRETMSAAARILTERDVFMIVLYCSSS
jgi:hypothetical protein